MTETVLAGVRTAPRTIDYREFPMPDTADGAAIMRVEVAGICGSDVRYFSHPRIDAPVIMGHENVGILERVSPEFSERHGVVEGDRIFVEHYVGCWRCEWCLAGEFRHCEATDWRTNPDARRYGYTSSDKPHHLWGGFSQYLYLPWNAVIHRVPEGVTAPLAGLVTPLSNGIQWALVDAKVGFNTSVLIQGPGQQGLSQVVACKQAGAGLIIVAGTPKDSARLELALALGADHVVDVTQVDPLEFTMQVTGGRGVDVVVDCTSGAGTAPMLLGIDALRRREGTLVVQGEVSAFPDFPLMKVTEKSMTIKSARGHSYRSVELAIAQLASGRFPLERLTTHFFGMDGIAEAIDAVGGAVEGAIHVSLMPWLEKAA